MHVDFLQICLLLSVQNFNFFNRYVDFINVMAYDYSGPWSHTTGFMAPLYSRSSDKSFDQTLSQVENFHTIFFNDKWMPFENCFYMFI